MASNISGSSDEELDDYTATEVLLGYTSKEPTDDPFNQLGGQPVSMAINVQHATFLSNQILQRWPDQANPPSASLAKCKVCSRILTLLLQLNGDLPERFAGHERRLYVFACRSKTCKKKPGSIRAIKGTKIDASASISSTEKRNAITQGTSQQTPPPMLGNSIFGKASSSSSNANSFSAPNPFAVASSSSSSPFSSLVSKPPQPPSPPSDLPATFAQKARISSPSPSPSPQKAPFEPWPPQSELPPPYPSYYLEADYETLDNTPSPAATPSKNFDIDNDPSSSGGSRKDDANAYESSMDTTFQKFASRLSHNPLQALRYEFGGTPLLYSKTDNVGKSLSASTPRIPRCENCGKARVFEVQLVPQAIAELEVEEEGLEGMEWGSVVVGVCGGDCGNERGEGWVWREEWVGVQWEESGGLGMKK